ncbi:DUF2142 domain-containing protein [Arcanobacterium phocisimile]|uniref:DUF2142 domain-containing protein n=1 Tax=Arcanobacterium phocisimile TaxID=1302235 RepID=A0ABX7IGI5_9ACTO|nr:DUF2142 domain-containing protein [Arcanobacterium phocisimile]QRV02241.1 DUF2142 domain-containing protein [Arcanobacterium phocisimile]
MRDSKIQQLRSALGIRSISLVIVAMIAFFGAGLGWVVASPIGGSPDDDYHMGSIWCPRPVGESCTVKAINGVDEVRVPIPVAAGAACHAFKSDSSASDCNVDISTNELMWSHRYDDGDYPAGYYAFQHLFIQHDVGKSIIVMRTVNLTIAILLLTLIGVFLRPEQRTAYLLPMVVTWIPMGFYFITSINPSSWAITGLYGYTVAMYGAATGKDWRRWVLLGLAMFSAVLCLSSRRDVSFYLFVVAVAFIFAIKWSKKNIIPGVAVAIIGFVGAYSITLGGQAKHVTASFESEGNLFRNALNTILDLPRYFAGMFGVTYGPGWFDTPVEGPATYIVLFVFAGAVMAGLRSGSWRKWMSASVILGAICGIPLVFILKGIFTGFGDYQPRYMLPLLGVLLFMLFTIGSRQRQIFELPQLILIALAIPIANSLALHIVMQRYTAGFQPAHPLNLDNNISWWWNTSISPMTVWVVASLAFVVAIVVVTYFAHRNSFNSDSVKKVPIAESSQSNDSENIIAEKVSPKHALV